MFTRFSLFAAEARSEDRAHRKEILPGLFKLSGRKLRLITTALAVAALPFLSAGATPG